MPLLPSLGVGTASHRHAGGFSPHLAWASSALPPSASCLHPGSSDAPNSARTMLSTGPAPPGRRLGRGPATVVLAALSPESPSSPPLCHAQLSLDTDTCQKGELTLSPPLRNLRRFPEPQGEATAPPRQGPGGLGLHARPLSSALGQPGPVRPWFPQRPLSRTLCPADPSAEVLFPLLVAE